MRRTLPLLCVLLVSLALAAGCRTRAIPTPEPIPVPAGLSWQNIEIAVLSAMTTHPIPAAYDPTVEMPEKDFDLLVWKHYVAQPGRSWTIESREPGRIVGVIQRARYVLRAQVVYDEHVARVSIVDSAGLDQQGNQISRRAASWILKLEQRIRAELTRFRAL